jgi:RimJ/RimL family protein N-acetyltransferase
LRLRAFVPGDASKVFRMSQEPGMRTWVPSQVYRDEAHAAAVLAHLIAHYGDPAVPRAGPLVLGIETREARELIGHVGFSPLGGDVEIGYAIEESRQRRGFATEAVRAACAWALHAFSLDSILGVTAEHNIASQRVLARAGFVRQRAEFMRFQGHEQRVVIYSLPPSS